MSLFSNDVISSIPCARCGGEVIEFSIPNDVWNKVIRPDGHEHTKEYLCANCWFNALRVALGIEAVEQSFAADGSQASAFGGSATNDADAAWEAIHVSRRR